MATTYKVLGQAAPAATTLTDLYIVPSATETVVSSLVITNRSSSLSANYRIAIAPNGETIASKHYIAFDVPMGAADSTILTLGMTVDSTDKILVQASTGDVSFNLFGMELA